MPGGRKPTTYGKSSRKPMVMDTFTQITSANERDPRIDPFGARATRELISYSLTQKQANSLTAKKATTASPPATSSIKRTPPTKQHRPMSTLGRSIQDNSIYDVPTSEDEPELRQSSTQYLARKKRKVVPEKEARLDDAQPVYDDASLQRHVAAEVARDEASENSSNKQTQVVSVRHSYKQRPTSRSSSNRIRENESRDKTKRNRGPNQQAYNNHSLKESLANPPRARPGPFKCSVQSTTTEGLRIKSQTSPDVNASVSYPIVLEASSSDVEAPLLNTPPGRGSKIPDFFTTPRQRELWSKLLVDDQNHASPSAVRLSGLLLNEKEQSKTKRPTQGCKIKWEQAHEKTPKRSHRRLVDTLNSIGKDHESVDENKASDESGSVSNDDHSEQSDVSILNTVITKQTSPSAESQERSQQPQDESASDFPQPLQSLQSNGLKVTYARQRSYLTDSDLIEVVSLSVPSPPEPSMRRATAKKVFQNSMTKIRPKDVYDDEFDDVREPHSGGMRSRHELKEAGNNVRLISELEDMLQELSEKSSITKARWLNTFIELVSKLQEPTTCRLFIDQGLESSLLAQLATTDNQLTNSIYAIALLQLIENLSPASRLAHIGSKSVVNFLVSLLGSDGDLLSSSKLRQYSLPGATRSSYKTLCDSILASATWTTGKPSILSCHIVGLQCLEYLVRTARETRSFSEMLSVHAIRRLVTTSIPAYSMASQPPSSQLSSVNVDLAISTLESCTAGNAAKSQESLWAGEALECMIGLLPLLDSWKVERYSESRIQTLQLYINLTQNNPGICEDFSTPGVLAVLFNNVTSDFEQISLSDPGCDRSVLLKHLLLSLGAFMNIAELSDVARRSVATFQDGSSSYLDVLLRLYVTKSESASEVITFTSKNLLTMLTFHRSYLRIKLAQMWPWVILQCSWASFVATLR